MFKKIKKALTGTPTVVLIRHGSTDLNNKDTSLDRIRGHEDIPLNDKGLEEVRESAKKLWKEYPHVDTIYSSDLSRAMDTAKICNEYYKAPIVSSNELRPWNLGVFQGKVTDTVKPQMDKMIENEDLVPKDGESFHDFRVKYLSYLKKIIAQAKKYNDVILVATHLRNCRLAEAWVKNGCPDDLSINKKVMEDAPVDPANFMEIPLGKK